MPDNSFASRSSLEVGDRSYEIHRLGVLGARVERLPYSLKILLEGLLRHEDGRVVRPEDVEALASWADAPDTSRELAFHPARVLMQDFTGVPAVVDLAAMRDAMADLGGHRASIRPQIPVELVIDHSVIADVAGRADAFARNASLELSRNRERYQLLRWGQRAFSGFRVVPPDTGICHQVNLEYLSRVVFADEEGRAYPDTLVGTDSHTPMVNGLGVLGWGVGGIEAEAAMLGQAVSMLTPAVVGVKLVGELREGTTATDLVLTIAETLRRHGVVGRFVEFFGPGVANVALENRATIGNMSPEYGSTCSIFPIDDETLRYLRFSGRPDELVDLVEAYAKEQGMFQVPGSAEPTFSEQLELDLGVVEPSLAGPARPQDRVPLTGAQGSFRSSLASVPGIGGAGGGDVHRVPAEAFSGASVDDESAQSFPASDPPTDGVDRAAAAARGSSSGKEVSSPHAGAPTERPSRPTKAVLEDGTEAVIDHGHVVIAAITSCTNTSNPQVMLAAGLLARNAVAAGLQVPPWVKTSLAPGSRVVTDYLERAGLSGDLEALGFHLVGYGCTTCIGNSGPLLTGVGEAVDESDLAVCAVLSGNRNFEGRIHAQVRMNYLASPPLVVAYALAGTMDVDLTSDPLGQGSDGSPVHLRDIWPSSEEVTATVRDAVRSEMFSERYAEVFSGDDRWSSLEVAGGEAFDWDPGSTYVRRPPFFEGMGPDPVPVADIAGARALAVLGDSITTDHISPAGTIKADGPAGRYLLDHGVEASDFNSYGARRGNHEVMIRGTFANVRLRNRLAGGVEGGVTRHLPDGELMTIPEAAELYAAEGTPLVVLAGKEYGSGSSRDWAAKGSLLLGVRAVLAESFERIHRSNLIGMGVLPLRFLDGQSIGSLGLSGEETFAVSGMEPLGEGRVPDRVEVTADGHSFGAEPLIATPQEAEYYRHGGILCYVARNLLRA